MSDKLSCSIKVLILGKVGRLGNIPHGHARQRARLVDGTSAEDIVLAQ